MTQAANPTSVRLTEENARNIEQFAKLTRRSRSYLINEALEAYIKAIVYLTNLPAKAPQ